MKGKKLLIETDGTTANTRISVDGKVIGYAQRVEFLANAEDKFVNFSIEVGSLDSNGKLKTKKTQIRDKNSQKFVEGEKVITQPISLEFE